MKNIFKKTTKMRTAYPRALSLLSATIIALLSTGCMRSTGTTEVGVLVKKFTLFGESGVQTTYFAPGSTYLVWPLIMEWYTFDTKIQNLEMVSDVRRGDRTGPDEMRFKTIDGNDIDLDAIVTYHIIPEKAPYILQEVARSTLELKDFVVRPIARSRTRDIFGQLRTEEFYSAESREKKAEEAVISMNEILLPWGVKVDRVSTKDYRFSPDYQKAIEDKKIADQMAEKFTSEAKATTEEYLRKLEQAKGTYNQMVAKADGEYKTASIEADAYYSQQEKRALAVRAEGEAEAKGITEMNKALAGSGGEIMVKMKLAEALQGKKIVMLPEGSGGIDLRSTNINDVLKIAGVEKLKEQTERGK